MRSRTRPVLAGSLVVACAALLADAAPAAAHGLGSEDPNRPVAEYLWLGTKHLLAGWDHLLFILAVVLVAGSLWRATKMLSLFVLGHSLTLALATFQEWRVSTTFVDVVIALSVVAVAAVGLQWRRPNWRLFGAGLFTFGLIHGLGLSTRLQDLGVSDDSLFWRVFLFNLGVEIGQAVAVLAFAALGWVLARLWGRPELLRRPAFTFIGLAGLIGAMVLTISAGGDEGETDAPLASATVPTTTAAAQQPACRVVIRDAAIPADAAAGGHPERRFYEPDETYPAADFGHVMGDGYIVVTYPPDLPDFELTELRIAGAEPGQREALVATTLGRELRCDRVDVDALVGFQEEWVAEYTGQP